MKIWFLLILLKYFANTEIKKENILASFAFMGKAKMIIRKLRSGSEAVSKCYATIPFQILALFLNTFSSARSLLFIYVAHTDMSEINVQAAEYSTRASTAIRCPST